MPNRYTELDHLRRRDRAKWIEVLRAVLVSEQGCLLRAHKVLGISRRQLYRVIDAADLWDVVRDARAYAAEERKRRRLHAHNEWGNLVERATPARRAQGILEPEPDWLARTRKALT